MSVTALSDALARLRGKLAAASPPRAVGGVCAGARAMAVAALAGNQEITVVVVPTPRDAEELLAGLDLVAPELGAVRLPAEAVEAYLGSTPPIGATASAAHALLRLASGSARCVVAPARLLPYPWPVPESLPARSPRIVPGQHLDPFELAATLVEIGYRRTEVVEEAGDFAQRGQVVDIGTPDRFLRILLDVDMVEALSEIDPGSQRTTAALDEASVPPLRLFASDETSRATLAANLESSGCVRAAGAALDGIEPQLWEGFLGWTAPHRLLWELGPHLVVVEPAAVLSELDRIQAALRHARETLARDGLHLPPTESWLEPVTRCREVIAAADRIDELIVEDGTPWTRVHTAPTPNLAARPLALVDELRDGALRNLCQVVVAASAGEAQRLHHLLGEAELPLTSGWPVPGVIGIVTGHLSRGFVWADLGLVVFGRADVTTLPPPATRRRTLSRVLADVRDLAPGDYVVHAEHGIGRFAGFRTLTLDGTAHECVELEYGGGGKLLVPLERADVIEKYASAEGPAPHMDRLGGSSWARTKSRVKKALKDLADDLLKVHAHRELAQGFAFSKDSPWQREFEEAFEYEPTEDQAQAIGEAKRDMESPRAMDRLLVGDVGYGKTEVAMRAAFKAVMDGKQVAVLTPTTVLAEQHFRTFSRRFAGFPVEIRLLSRFAAPEAQKDAVKGLGAGTVDMVIGTHRMLAKDVAFRDLGLVIIDEEQRFGVAQKEKLKAIKASVDVLALSATPIPRTLNLGLLGLRDVSVIETPPRDRLAVQTHVLPFRRETVREAILTELARGGQVFFVHNRVASIGAIAELLREIVPEATVVVAHGQMEERALEKAMNAFVEERADVLLATSLIENGLDIPNANTLIVNRADKFGLAQLYQLRGRVGRSDRLAFAYLLVPPEQALSEEARARLAAILEFAELGAGFRIAARDLEIRGAGNLLGAEQHGNLRAVGYETYCRLLEEAVAELRGEAPPTPPSAVELTLGLDLKLPDAWIAEESLRLGIYRRVAAARGEEELTAVAAELVDRFGAAPHQLGNLLLYQKVRRQAEGSGVLKVRRTGLAFELSFSTDHPAAHDTAMSLLARAADATLTPSGVLRLPCQEHDPAAATDWLARLLPGG